MKSLALQSTPFAITMKSSSQVLASIAFFGAIASNVWAEDFRILHLPVDVSQSERTEIFPHNTSVVYQQAFSSELFAKLPDGGLVIRDVILYTSPFFHDAASGEVKGISIYLSTIARSVDSLSPVFGENFGSDRKLLYNESQSSYFSASDVTPGHAAGAFVGLGGGFFYNPAKGNLLVEILGLHLPNDFPLDAVRNSPFTYSVQSNESGTAVGQVSGDALVLGFDVTIVPEPSSEALIGIGLTLTWLYRRNQVNRGKESHVAL